MTKMVRMNKPKHCLGNLKNIITEEEFNFLCHSWNIMILFQKQYPRLYNKYIL